MSVLKTNFQGNFGKKMAISRVICPMFLPQWGNKCLRTIINYSKYLYFKCTKYQECKSGFEMWPIKADWIPWNLIKYTILQIYGQRTTPASEEKVASPRYVLWLWLFVYLKNKNEDMLFIKQHGFLWGYHHSLLSIMTMVMTTVGVKPQKDFIRRVVSLNWGLTDVGSSSSSSSSASSFFYCCSCRRCLMFLLLCLFFYSPVYC